MSAAAPASAAPTLPAWAHRLAAHRGLIVPVAFVGLLVVLLVPLPPAVLDAMICLNIAVAVIILLTTIYMKHPLDFSVFPSLLLATTLFRLVLNVASTRLILTADAPSVEAAERVAGEVIWAFGSFVAGGSLFVGVIIFLILMVVQFMVVTKGAGRVSEVAARFTLDAMPGKQMAIDSDLSAGAITEGEARERRLEIRREADFFGAMDGASKFVKGDATAGIIITAINILGGFAVGIIDKGWEPGQVAELFTKLTIGDGLTSQIPSFVIAIAAALIVTRSGDDAELGDQLTSQLASQPRGLAITAGFLGLLCLTPLPTVPLLVAAGSLAGLAWAMARVQRVSAAGAAPAEPGGTVAGAMAAEQPIEELLRVDLMELEIGYALVPLVDRGQGGDLLDRISSARRQLASELGLVMPPVRIRDDMQLGPNEYRVKIRGAPVASGESRTGRLLAMDPGLAAGRLPGERTTEPTFGLEAWWIEPSVRGRAEAQGYTVVDPASVLVTHIQELVRRHADELLTREEVGNLIDGLKERSPRVVEEVIPGVIKPAELQKILQKLLRERVPIRDLATILEAVGDWGPRTRDPDILLEYVRHALRRTICEPLVSEEDGARVLRCVTLDPALEDQVNAAIDRGGGGMTLTMSASRAAEIGARIVGALEPLTGAGRPPVVVASPQVRAAVRQLAESLLPAVVVLGYNEIAQQVQVESVGLVPALETGG